MGTVEPSSETVASVTGTASGSDATALTGYHFVSWTNAGGTVVSTDAKLVPATENGLNVTATYTANFAPDAYTVSFNANGHGTAPADEVGTYGYTVTEPAAPSESGYTFGGWYKEAACTNAWNFASDLVSGNMTLYAKWTKNTTGSTGSSESSDSTSYTGHWVKNSTGWWYQNSDGTWPSNTWKQINGKWYHFDENGYMQTGWILDNGKWYYLDGSGAMVTGLFSLDGYWYYFWADGSMAVGDVVIDGVTHHFNDRKPEKPTYDWDSKSKTWKKNENTADLPYGAETE